MKRKNKFEKYIPKKAQGEFIPHRRFQNWFQYSGMYPTCGCIIIFGSRGKTIEIHNFGVYSTSDRGKGYGQTMIENVREIFPHAYIWVRTWTHSRGFWEKMKSRGCIDDIANPYEWPCHDTTCLDCHPNVPVKFARILIPTTLQKGGVIA